MPLSQTHPKLGAIRRQFSHLSSSSRPKCKLVFSSKSVSPPLIDQTAKVVDSNENQVNFPSTEFDLSANLEAYKKRCKTLEMENARLMDNQGKIITESNRKSERHLEEIRCLKEQMDAQRRTNGELLRWAQLADDESRRAKELSKEWQKLGQCNNQLMKKEVHSHQLQINELEAKMAKLVTENLELKRLCLYLDEQRQAFWRELASAAGNTKVSFSTCSNSVHHFPMECGRCSSAEDDITCRRSGGTNASLATELVDLKLDKVTKRRGKLNGEEENEAKKGAIRMDYGQEEVLQSICYELTNSMATSSNGTNESVMAPNFSGSAPQIGASGNQPMTTVGTNCASIRPLSNSTVISNCPSAASTPLYSEFAGFSFSSLEDPTAVVVGHELDNTDGERSTAEQGLKVHELCTISEEEEKTEGKIRHKLVEKLGRELAETLDGAGCCSMVAETGSMFTSLLQSVDQPKQQQLIEAFGGMELSADLVTNHRNSTGGSSTSSGAFSGISRYTDEDSEDTETMEGKGKGGRDEAEDDLPPRMPLITPNECRPFVRHSFREFPSDHRSSSSMAVSVTAVEQQFLQRQSSTLPRLPLFTEPQSHGRTKTKLEGTTESQKGKQSQQMPVRVRVRPPPMQLPGVIKGDCQAEGKGEGGESHGSLVRIVQRMGTAKNGLLGEY